MKKSPKRQYRNSLEFVASGFVACWRNVGDLVGAARVPNESGYFAQSLSLSVLALEEPSKLYAADGLLFARPDDHKAKAFNSATKGHETKLIPLETFPLRIGVLSQPDPRFGTEAHS